jgi:hypothetical protein
LIKEEQRVRTSIAPVDYGSADDGFLDAEVPDLGPLQEAADAAELAEAMSGLSDDSGGPLPALDPIRPLACAVARALTEAGFRLHHCARHHPRYRLGGVCLLPVAASHAPAGKAGVVASWTAHDLLSLDWCRWHECHGALGRVLGVLGFEVTPFGSGGAHIVTDAPTTAR